MVHTSSGIAEDERRAFADLAASSVRLITELQDATGAYPASPTFSAYRGYSWFRDGAFIADGMSAAGAVDSASRFFDWCSSILLSRREKIEEIVSRAAAGDPAPDSEMLPTRFTLGGADGADEWWDFQLDGYGTWLWAAAEHSRRHGEPLERWSEAIALTVDYLASSWDRPCFDWWEEHHDQVHVSTLGCIVAGLRAVVGVLDGDRATKAQSTADAAERLIMERGIGEGHLVKWLGASTVDASLVAVVSPLGAIAASSPTGLATITAIDEQLNEEGGVHRFLADTFFGGGQWPLLSCMLGLAFSAAGMTDRAVEQLRWAAATADENGAMPEQVEQHLLDPSMVDEWVERWGTSARPLLWSHAMFLRLAVELGVVDGGVR